MICTKYINSPLGELLAGATQKGICSLEYTKDERKGVNVIIENANPDNNSIKLLEQLEVELAAYFKGELKVFTVPLDTSGTPFQLEVWNKLIEIPYGTTVTYSELAKMMNSPNAVRAVGGANAKNPVMIVVPCHRVNGANGKLTGYSGGLYAKKFLLELESGKRRPVQTVLMFP